MVGQGTTPIVPAAVPDCVMVVKGDACIDVDRRSKETSRLSIPLTYKLFLSLIHCKDASSENEVLV